MEKKVVLIVLVVIAVVAFMFLGAGLFRDRGKSGGSGRNYEPGNVLKKMDGLFARTRKPFDRTRMVTLTDGCSLTPQGVLSFTGECGVVIKPSKTKSSAFVLVRGGNRAEACYAFSNEELRECWGDDETRAELDKDEHRFVVTGDSAFMQLRCNNLAGSACNLAVK